MRSGKRLISIIGVYVKRRAMRFCDAIIGAGLIASGTLCWMSEALGYEAPSFLCSTAVTAIEATICNFPPLAGKDGLLAVQYQLLQSYLSSEEKEALLRAQRAWIAERDTKCSTGRAPSSASDTPQEKAQRRCLDNLYSQRLSELKPQIVSAAAKRLRLGGSEERFAPNFWGVHLPISALEEGEQIRDDAGDLFSIADVAIGLDGSFRVAYAYSTVLAGKVRRHFNVYSSKHDSLVFHEAVVAGKHSVGREWSSAIWDKAALVYEYPNRLGSVKIADDRVIRVDRSGRSYCGHGYDGFVSIEEPEGQSQQKIAIIAHRSEPIRTAVTLCNEKNEAVVDGWFATWGSAEFYYLLDLADGTYLILSKHLGTLIRCEGALDCPWATPANGVYFSLYDHISRVIEDAMRKAPLSPLTVESMDEAVLEYLQNR